MLQISVAMERFRKIDFASDAVDTVLEKMPNDFGVHIQRAGIYVKQKKYPEAMQSIKTSVGIGKEKAQNLILNDPRFEIFKTSPTFQKMIQGDKQQELNFKKQDSKKSLF